MSENLRLTEIAEALAKELGEGWSVEERDNLYGSYDWSRKIAGPGGLAVGLVMRDHAAKVETSGYYPQRPGEGPFTPYGITHPEASCSTSRPTEKIVADIVRRLMPPYRELYAQAYQRAKEYDEYETRKQAATDRVAAAFAGTQRGTSGHVYTQRGSMQVSPDGVSFAYLSVTIAQAIKIAAVLQERPS